MKKIYTLFAALTLTFCMGGISFSAEGMILNEDGKYKEQNQVEQNKNTCSIIENYTCGNNDDTLHVCNFLQNFYCTIEGRRIKTLIFNMTCGSEIPNRNKEKEIPLRNCKTVEQIVIPDSFTKIGSYVFQKFTGLKKISIPLSVISIDKEAFEGCTNLRSIVLPSKLEEIANYAFCGCKSLEEILIPLSVISIGKGAFEGCTNLRSIVLPSKLEQIADYTFRGCKNLKEISIPSSVKSIGKYSLSETELVEVLLPSVIRIDYAAFAQNDRLQKVSIPNVDNIGEYVFCKCECLTDVSLSDKLKSIPNYAFTSCKVLKKIKIPTSVQSIGDYAFQYSGLLEISIPNVTQIGHHAFCGSNIREVSLSSELKTIENSVFFCCKNLKNISIPSTVTCINNSAFSYAGLMSIFIPRSVESIEPSAFNTCKSLEKVSIEENTKLTEIGCSVFAKTNIKSFIIPKEISFIGQYAFDESALTSISIPQNVIYVYGDVFSSCKHLQIVEILNPKLLGTSIGEHTFIRSYEGMSIFVPYVQKK